jgi:hypothetical protein
MNDKRNRLVTRWGALKLERSSFDTHWRSLSEYILPRSGRFFVTDNNRGERARWNQILDSTATRAARTLAAGMMAGMTSPARPWFRLSTGDRDLDKSHAVRSWLEETRSLVLMVFQKSNTYRSLHSLYEELGVFGTAADIVLSDFDDVLRHYPLTAGEYAIGQNDRGEVDTLYREFRMTVGQMVQRFGYDRCTQSVRNMYDRGAVDQYRTVLHAIEPRTERDATKRDARNMPFRSCYFEEGARHDEYLSDSGFARFPVVAPRWSAQGGDIYGTSPGMEALGDIRQLQHQQLRKAQVIDYQTDPPLAVPASMQNRDVDRLPGGVTYVDMAGGQNSVRSLFDVTLNLAHLREDIIDVRERINGAFYADLFLMLANSTQTNMTATEVAERHEEKLLMLGPVLERLHNELLSPLIDIAFDHIAQAGILPPPPPELEGIDLDVEFVSMLAQAQRAVATNSIDRFVGTLGAVAGMKPDVLDKLDTDALADVYSDALGVDPALIVPTERVARIRAQRAEAQAQAQQALQMQQAAVTAKDAATARATDPEGIGSVIDQFSGYTTV